MTTVANVGGTSTVSFAVTPRPDRADALWEEPGQ